MYIDGGVMVCAEAATEVEALRKALGEAEEKVVQQQAARKKLKARVKEVQRELQDAVKNARPWSMMRRLEGPNSPRLVRARRPHGMRPRPPFRRSRRPRRSRRVRHSVCKANMQRGSIFY